MERTRRHRRSGRGWKVFFTVVLVLIAVRLALPFGIQAYVNHQLDEHPDYEGSVGSVSLSLIRGEYSVEDVELHRVDVDVDLPLFTVQRLEFSMDWGAVFDGELVGEARLIEPRVNFVEGPPDERQVEVDPELQEQFEELFPVRLDRIEVVRGELFFSDPHSDPAFDIFVDDIYITVLNLTNIRHVDEDQFASVEMIGRPMHEGYLSVQMEFDPLAEDPTFDLQFQLRDLPLPELNDFLRAYGNFDLHQGTMDMYGELAALEGRFEGYVRPFFYDINVVRWQEDVEEEGLLQTMYEGLVEVATDLLESPEHGMIATRIPLEGDLEDPEVGVWSTVMTLLRNAFIEALIPGLEHSIGLGDVG